MGIVLRRSLLGVLVIAILLVVGLKVYFTSDRLRTLIVPQLSDVLKRPVVLQDVALGFWGGVHVSVSGLEVGARAGFGSLPFLRVSEAHIYVDFWPLLSGDAAIGLIQLMGPHVSVVILENGEANYADLSQNSDDGASQKQDISVGEIRIEDGVILYADLGKQTQMQFQGIDYTLNMLQKESGWDLDGELSVGRVGWQQGEQRDTLDTGVLHLTHQLQMGQNAWVVDALGLDWAGLALTMSGRVETVGDVLNLDLKIEEPGLDLGTTKLREVAKLPMDVVGKASVKLQVVGALNLNMTPPQYPNVTGRVVLSDVEISDKNLIEEARIDMAALSLADGVLILESLKGHAFGGQMSASGRVDLSGILNTRNRRQNFPIEMRVKADRLRLKSMLGEGPSVDADGTLTADLNARALLDADLNPMLEMGKYDLLGTLSLQDGLLKTPQLLVPVDSLDVSIGFLSGNVIEIKKMMARAGESDFAVSGRVDGLLDYVLHPEANIRPQAVTNVQARVLNMDALFPTAVAVEGDQTSGVLVGMRTIDGRVDLAIGSLMSDSTRYTDFRAVAVAKDGILKVDRIRANTMGGGMEAQTEIDGRKNGLIPIKATAVLSHIQAERFLKNYMRWSIPVFGQLGVSVAMNGKMDSTLTLVEKAIRAEGEARVDEGRVVNWPWLQASSGLVPHLKFLNFSDLPLKSLVAPFKMDEGRVFLNQMGFRSGDVGFQVVGSVGVDGTLDMTVDGDVPASRLNVSQLGLDRVGLNLKPDTRIPLRIVMGGTSDKPKIEIVLKPEAKKMLEDKSQEVKEKIKDKTEGLLKSLF